jgi:Tol biopolymer transport system component
MNSDGSNQKRLTYNTYQDRQPLFSPDGTNILYGSFHPRVRGCLSVMGIDGSKNLLITKGGENLFRQTANRYFLEFGVTYI